MENESSNSKDFDQFLEESLVEGNERMVFRDINAENSKTLDVNFVENNYYNLPEQSIFLIVFRCRAKDKDQTGIRKEAFLDEGVTPLLLKLSLDQDGCYWNKNLIQTFNCSLRWICTVLIRFADVIDEQNRYPYYRLEYD